jgi:hypothetical protein
LLTPFAARNFASTAASRARWDGRRIADVRGTYGEYLLGKVGKVFPDLASGL